MIVLLTGASGQVGRELQLACPPGVDLDARDHVALDVTDESEVERACREIEPSVVVNAAAYTAVDEAEADRDAAFAINSTGAGTLARAAADVGARLVHLSTDFVFDGHGNQPYRPDDPTSPLSVYGRSKLDGEEQVRAISPDAVILRSSWIYSRFGGNFVKTMLRLMASRPKLGVVSDQIGCPTWARGLAETVWQIAAAPSVRGTLHWTDAGVASWYDLAVAIRELGAEAGLLTQEIQIEPIRTEAYPTPAERPRYSVLDSTATREALSTTQRHWRQALRLMIQELEVDDLA